MKIAFHFSGKRLTIGGFLMALGAAMGTQIADRLPQPWMEALQWLGLVGLLLGFLVSVAGLVRITSGFGRIYPVWQTERVLGALAAADPRAAVGFLQTSFPDAALLIPTLKKLLKSGKRFKVKILMTHPTSEAGQQIIGGRVRSRDETSDFHAQEIQSQLNQIIKLKQEIDEEWVRSQDGAKLDLQVRLYDHLPFGPQVHVGDEKTFVGFFLAAKSSINAPMLELRPTDEPIWGEFRADFDTAWQRAEPYEPSPATQPS